MTNINEATGIPYGTIYMQHIDPEVADELWYTHGEDLSYKEAREEIRNEVNAAVEAGELDEDDFDAELDSRCDNLQIDEPIIEGECEGVKYHISWLGGAPLLWVFESLCTGMYAGCSPCVPGAGDLDSPDPDGILCYDVPAEWRRKE